MRTEYLRYFITVVDQGSINKAANALFISPQGLSQAIQKLEQEVGVPLFFRDGNKLELSAAGKQAYLLSQEVLEKSQKMLDELSAYRDMNDEPYKNELTILAAPIIISTFLPVVLEQLRKRFQNLYVQVEETDPNILLKQFEQKPDSICILSMPELEMERLLKDKPQALNFTELFRAPLMAAVSAKSGLANRSSIHINDVRKYPLVIYGVEERLLNHLALDADLQEVVFRSANLDICRTVLAGDKRCIGFTNRLPDHYMKNQNLIAIPMLPSVDIITGFMMTPKNAANPIVQEFIQLMKTELNNV